MKGITKSWKKSLVFQSSNSMRSLLVAIKAAYFVMHTQQAKKKPTVVAVTLNACQAGQINYKGINERRHLLDSVSSGKTLSTPQMRHGMTTNCTKSD